MLLILVLAGLLALAVTSLLLVRLVRLVARDGLGSNPVPRSHAVEVGTWAQRELAR
jgi:hypothetical protein